MVLHAAVSIQSVHLRDMPDRFLFPYASGVQRRPTRFPRLMRPLLFFLPARVDIVFVCRFSAGTTFLFTNAPLSVFPRGTALG